MGRKKEKASFDWSGTVKQTVITVVISSIFGVSGYFLAKRYESEIVQRQNLSSSIQFYHSLSVERSSIYKLEKKYLKLESEKDKQAFVLAAVKEMTDDSRLQCEESYYTKMLGKEGYQKMNAFYVSDFLYPDSSGNYANESVTRLLTFFGQLRLDIDAGLLNEEDAKAYFGYYLYWFSSFAPHFLKEYENRIQSGCDERFQRPNWLSTLDLYVEWKLIEDKVHK